MELKLPMVVVQRSARLVEAWLPGCPGIRGSGTSLSALRDDLALAVMLRFEQEPVAALGAYQLPPHLSLRHVKIATTAQDRDANRKYRLEGRIGVLVEKWPHDDFHVVTPTRLPEARFALGKLDDLDAAVTRRIAGWCLEHELETLDKLHAEQRERLDILEVAADPPSILPRTPPPPPRARRAKPDKKTGKPRQSPEELEEKRRQRRLQVKALRAVARIGSLLAFLVGWWMSRRITGPVLALARASDEIAAGNFAVRVPASSEWSFVASLRGFGGVVPREVTPGNFEVGGGGGVQLLLGVGHF